MKTEPTLPELVKMTVQQGQIQRHLYKYRTLNSNLDKILINDELWFSNPNDFNDPFDCQIVVDSNNSQQEIEQFIIKNSLTPVSSIEATRLAKIMISKPQEWDKIVNETIQTQINASGVCCFGGNADNILLWSHYTDSHKGVCLKFDVLADLDFFVFPMKVTYQPNYPIYNHLKNQTQLVDSLIKTKSDVWTYEEEVRIVKLKPGLHKFKKTALVEVIFGCKSNESEIKRIKDLANNNGYSHLKFSKATLKIRQYGLDFVSI